MKRLIILFIALLLSAGAYAADTSNDSPPLTKKEQRRTLRGYKGFVEVGVGATLHDFDYIGDGIAGENEPTGFGIDVLTTHGYQLNNHFFLGGGVGITECTESNMMVPIFADMRINILNKRISPVIGFKWGYAVGDHYGAYLSCNLGLRIGLKEKLKSAIYAVAEVSFIGDSENLITLEEKSLACLRILLRVGYEF